jgi:hypothetical protein
MTIFKTAKVGHNQGALEYLTNHGFGPDQETEVTSMTNWITHWLGVVVDFEKGQIQIVKRLEDEMLPHRVLQYEAITSPGQAFAIAIEFVGQTKAIAAAL